MGDALEDVVAADCGCLRILSCRVRLTGRTALHGLAGEPLAGLVGDVERTRGDVMVAVERIVLDTRSAVDLLALAGGSAPPATLAALVLALDAAGGGGSGDAVEDVFAETPAANGALQALLTEAAEAAAGVHRARPYAGLPDGAGEQAGGEPAAIADIVRRQALLLLDELPAQKEAPRG